MTRTVLATLTALVVMACVPSLALAKGPSKATIDGPGLAEALSIPFDSEWSAAFWRIVDYTGFFPAAFGQTPDPMLSKRPRGSLGPRYVMTYTLPAGPDAAEDVIRQDVYPYAKPRPVSYMEPGQRLVLDQETHGGWFVAGPSLKRALVAAGLPVRPPVVGGGSAFPWPVVAAMTLLGALLAIGIGARAWLRQHARWGQASA